MVSVVDTDEKFREECAGRFSAVADGFYDLRAARGDAVGLAAQNYASCLLVLCRLTRVPDGVSRTDMAKFLTNPVDTADVRDRKLLAHCWYRLGQCALAISDLPTALVYFDSSLALRRRWYLELPRHEQNASHYEVVCRVLEARRMCANTLVLMESYSLASAMLQAGLGEAPSNYSKALYLFDFAFCLLKSGMYVSALDKLEQGVALWPVDHLDQSLLPASESLPLPVYVHKAQILVGLKRDDEAYDCLQIALRVGTRECHGNAFHPNMEVVYEAMLRLLRRRIGKKWAREAQRIKIAIEQCRRGLRPLRV
jgi:tetratricopeptide (TPR) repeat protein